MRALFIHPKRTSFWIMPTISNRRGAMADKASLRNWCQEQLSVLLGVPAGFELTDYMLSFESEREIREQIASLLDVNDPKVNEFKEQLIKRWKYLQTNYDENPAVYKKMDINNTGTKKKIQNKNIREPLPAEVSITHTNEDETGCGTPPNKMTVETAGAEFLDKNKLMPQEVKKTPSPFKKKNLKYVPLYSADGKLKTDTVMLPGRHACQCLAQKHKLINNCMYCGRIVCEQEGSGPCMFCGNLVCSPEEQDIISRESKKSKKLMEQLLSQKAQDDEEEDKENKNKDLEKAVAHKNKLLEFDKNCTKRTKVIDDEADYFSMDNRWLTKNQRKEIAKRDKELREKRFASRLDRKFTLDFAGRRVVEDEEQNYMYHADDDIVKTVGETTSLQNINKAIPENSLIDPRITIEPPKFSKKRASYTQKKITPSRRSTEFNGDSFKGDVTQFLKSQQQAVRNSLRLQDKELNIMTDQGMCLSMHQPWASLLVCGIKRLEGRSWYTAHRGRLWIASAAKVSDKETIQQVENSYRSFHSGERIDFPKNYPSGALLGCVNVVDCVGNKEYFKENPEDPEENDSPYLLVCDNPQQLKIKFPIKGKHKIYKLDTHIHKAGIRSLEVT